ncbi:MAG: hypothetical protein QXR45_09625 [Candidatus Bathyarchaeia archaeon]
MDGGSQKKPPEYGFRDSNVNILLGNGPYDPHTGGEPLRGVLCKIYKYEDVSLVQL